MRRFFLGATMLAALAVVPITVSAQDHDQNHDNAAHRQYYDRVHKDNHEWNDNESTTWNRYRDDHHVKQSDFARVSRKQQQNYWNWRHEHPDNH